MCILQSPGGAIDRTFGDDVCSGIPRAGIVSGRHHGLKVIFLRIVGKIVLQPLSRDPSEENCGKEGNQ